MRSILTALILTATIASACAEPPDYTGSVYYHPATGKYRDIEGERVMMPGDPIARRVRRENRIIHRERYERYERREREERHDDGRCKPRLEIVGDKALSEAAAQKRAIQEWSKQVRFRYGERYMGFETAENPVWECPKTANDEGLLERAENVVGRVHITCQLHATPCHSLPVR